MKLAATKERTKVKENAARVKQGRRAGTGMVCIFVKEVRVICIQSPQAKGKPPKLLQQSGGTPRSEKRRLHLQTV